MTITHTHTHNTHKHIHKVVKLVKGYQTSYLAYVAYGVQDKMSLNLLVCLATPHPFPFMAHLSPFSLLFYSYGFFYGYHPLHGSSWTLGRELHTIACRGGGVKAVKVYAYNVYHSANITIR